MTSRRFGASYAYLSIGFIPLFFFNGRWILPVAAFITPVFLIRFLRFQDPLKGFLAIVLVGWVSNIFVWKGMLPMTGFFYYFISLMMSVFTALTFLIDRIYYKHVKGILSTLVFPSAYVIMDYIVISTNPSGSYGTLAHTQTSLPLIQIIAVTGIWGLTFLIMWTASIINWLWDHGFGRPQLKQVLMVFGIPFLLIIVYGQVRINTPDQDKTVRIASINIDKTDLKNQYHSVTIMDSVNDRYLINAELAAASGAKIVFGVETIINLKEEKATAFIEKARIIAREKDIYLGLPMAVILKASPPMAPENKIVWISPKGEVLFTYHKAKPTNPNEGDYGDGIIKYFDSHYGRVGSAICFDMDFPSLINQVGKMDIDIMLVPGNDWKEIAPYHTYVASFRAIEHGFNLVRGASRGLSAAFNHKGQVLASMDFFRTDDLIFYADIPTAGHKTVYSILGDYFAWLCILIFLLMSIIFINNKWKRKSVKI